MIRTVITALLQLVGIISFAWSIDQRVNRINMPEELAQKRSKFAGDWKYLTYINMWLQLIFFIIAFFANFVKSLRGVRDLLFASAAFPIGMFVGVMFWSLWAIDRELIFPKVLDQVFSLTLNHCMHTTVIPLQVGQLLLVKHGFPSRSLGFSITALLCLGYILWVQYINFMTGHWVYPVLKVLSLEQRIVFFIFSAGMGGCLYLIGDIINKSIWSGLKNQKKNN